MRTFRKLFAYAFVALMILGILIAVYGLIAGLVTSFSTEFALFVFFGPTLSAWKIVAIGAILAVLGGVGACWCDPQVFKQTMRRITKAASTAASGLAKLIDHVATSAIPSIVWIAAAAILGVYLLKDNTPAPQPINSGKSTISQER